MLSTTRSLAPNINPALSQSPASAGATLTPPIRPNPSSASAGHGSNALYYAWPVHMGPLSRHASVPARPKPGRRMADEPISKRKAQVRQAQRNFHQRKLEHSRGLETNNEELRTKNQRLLVEIQRLTRAVNESQQLADQFRNELEDWQRGYSGKKDWMDKNLSAIGRFQGQAGLIENQSATWCRQHEAKAAQADALDKKLAVLQRQPSLLSPSCRVLRPHSSSPRDLSPRQSTSTPVMPPSTRRHTITGDCGSCEETGDRACVDSYIGLSVTTKETSDLSQRKTFPMSIQSILSPPRESQIRARTGSQATPNLMNGMFNGKQSP